MSGQLRRAVLAAVCLAAQAPAHAAAPADAIRVLLVPENPLSQFI